MKRHELYRISLFLVMFLIISSFFSSAELMNYPDTYTSSESYRLIGEWGGFSSPEGIAVDSSGYVYVVNSIGNTIRKLDSSGNPITTWNSTLFQPRGICVDSNRNVYVSSPGSKNIVKFDSEGKYLGYTIATKSIQEIGIDSLGYIYYFSWDSKLINKFYPSWISAQQQDRTDLADSVVHPSAMYWNICGIAVEPNGNVTVLYPPGSDNSLIEKFDKNLKSILWKRYYQYSIGGLGIDMSGNIYMPTWDLNNGAYGTNIYDSNLTYITNISGAYGTHVAIDSSLNVYVTDPNYSTIKKYGKILAAPTITLITPSSGDNSDNITATITGTNFKTEATVKLTRSGYANITASRVLVPSSSQISCTIPIYGAAGGAWNVVVTNPDGQADTAANGFTIIASAPTITTVTPSSGKNTGDVVVTITGSNFRAGASVSLTKGSIRKDCPLTAAVTATQLKCTLPIKGITAGYWNLSIRNTDGTSITKTNAFTVLSGETSPTITKIIPNSGYNSWTMPVTITGKHFLTTATVKLTKGSVTKTASIQKITRTQITCTLPLTGAPVGPYTLIVRNTDGTSGSKSNAFTVLAAGKKPTITAVTPKSGISSKNTVVTISGTNFRTKAVVQIIKGKTVKTATIKSVGPKKIICTLPTNGAASGKWNVKITNADHTTNTKTGGFTIKKAATGNKVDVGQVSGIVLFTPVSMPSSAVSSRSTLTGGALVPVHAPAMNPGIPVF